MQRILAKVCRVSTQLPEPTLQILLPTLRGWGYKTVPSDRTFPLGLPDMEVFRLPEYADAKNACRQMILSGQTPVVYRNSTQENTPLPKLPGVYWKPLGKKRTWMEQFHAGLSSLPTRFDASNDPGDWQFPTAKDGKYWANCFIRVADLQLLPLEILRDETRVRLPWSQKYDGYFRDSEILSRGTSLRKYHSHDAPYRTKLNDNGSEVVIRARGNKDITKGQAILTGPEILERVPWEVGLKMSINGWPLRNIPIAYLVFFASKGQMPRRKPDDLRHDIQWHDGSAERAPAHGNILDAYDPLYSAVLRYLDSCEGRTRLDRSDLLIRRITRTVHNWFGQDLTIVNWEAPDLDKDRPDNEIGAGKFIRSHVYYHTDSPRSVHLGMYQLAEDDSVIAEVSRDAVRALVLKYRSVDGDTSWKSPRPGQDDWGMPLARETYSQTDRDRFGPWGSQPTAKWLPTGRTPSLTSKISLSLQDGDSDPCPPGYELGLTDATRTTARTEDWSPTAYVDEDYDWHPPVVPSTHSEAYRRAFEIEQWLERQQQMWDRRHEDYRYLASHNVLSNKDERQFFLDQEETLDLFGSRRMEFVQLLAADLQNAELVEGIDVDEERAVAYYGGNRRIQGLEEAFLHTYEALDGQTPEPEPPSPTWPELGPTETIFLKDVVRLFLRTFFRWMLIPNKTRKWLRFLSKKRRASAESFRELMTRYELGVFDGVGQGVPTSVIGSDLNVSYAAGEMAVAR